MRIGVPKEVKLLEHRVALLPELVKELVDDGHVVYIEIGAGEASGYYDDHYRSAGA